MKFADNIISQVISTYIHICLKILNHFKSFQHYIETYSSEVFIYLDLNYLILLSYYLYKTEIIFLIVYNHAIYYNVYLLLFFNIQYTNTQIRRINFFF